MWKLEKKYSPTQFSVFRILFGLYLSFYFFRLIPFGKEIFSSEGMVSKIDHNWTNILLPDTFSAIANPSFVTFLLCILGILSISLSVGFLRRISAILIWLGWIILYNLNNFTGDPSLPFVGLLLLSLSVIPVGEPLSLSSKFFKSKKLKEWYMPSILYWGIWIIFGASFTISGLEKLASPAWSSGAAMTLLYWGPVTFHYALTDMLRALPMWLGQISTWVILYSQIFALPSIFFKRTRLVFWLITTISFALGLFILNLTDVLIAMLLFYLFVFDSTWFTNKSKKLTVFLDEDCRICSKFGTFILQEDLANKFTVETFQGELIKEVLDVQEIKEMKYMVLMGDKALYRGSDAFIHSVANLGGLWVALKILFIFPARMRDKIYIHISTRRQRLKKTCSVH